MRTVEVEGNSRVDATRRGLELLAADIDDVKVEVLREEPRGLLGFLGFKRVTVRVTLVEENTLEQAGEIINKLVSFLPVPVEARVEMRKHNVYLELAGHELRQFQRQEDVADALGHVLELIINRHAKNKITVKTAFVEDKLSRDEELHKLARAAGDRAAARGKEEALAPMSPRDRRTVHMTLEQDPRVVTVSSGKGNKRHVVVHPAAAQAGPARKGEPPARAERSRPPTQARKTSDKPDEKSPRSSRRRRRSRPKKSPAPDNK